MPTNVRQFNIVLESAAKKIRGDLTKFYRMVCIEVLKRIVLRTAVDTGRARGNWQAELGRAASGILDVEGSEEEMASFSIDKGITKLSDIPPYSLVHITNNVEYLYYLEYVRRSEQFPEGMVEITLTELAGWLAGIK